MTRSGSTNFDDSGEYLTSSGITFNPSTDPFTFTAWIQLDNIDQSRVVWQQMDGVGTGRSIIIVEVDNDLASYTVIGPNPVVSTGVSANTWHWVALTGPGGSGNYTVWLDDNFDTANGTPASSTGQLRIGQSKTIVTTFDGQISYPCYYNRELSTDELLEIKYKPYSIANGLTWAPDFLDTGGGAFVDLSGNNTSKTVSGTPTPSTDGPPVFFEEPERG